VASIISGPMPSPMMSVTGILEESVVVLMVVS
jgi:hypothetical protein